MIYEIATEVENQGREVQVQEYVHRYDTTKTLENQVFQGLEFEIDKISEDFTIVRKRH